MSCASHQGVQIAVIAPEINHAAGDHWRRKNRAYALYFGDAGEHVVIEIGNVHCLVVRASIRFGEGCQPLPGGIRLKNPGARLGRKINGGQLAVMGTDVNLITGDRG